MNLRLVSLLSCSIVCLVGGCDALALLLPSTVTVRLVNNGDFRVDGDLYYDDDESALDGVDAINALDNFLREFGSRVEFDVAPGDTFTFTRSCDDLQAIYIDDADLRAILLSPEDDTDVLYQVSTPYAPQAEGGWRWDDSAFGIEWPNTEGVILSEKDRTWPDYRHPQRNPK